MSDMAMKREAAPFLRFHRVAAMLREFGRRHGASAASFIIVAAATSLAGCAPWARAEDTPLIQAGFTRMQPEMARQAIASDLLPPYLFAHRSVNGVETVLYYDPSGCRCVYSGTPQNYAQFNRNFYELEFERAHSGGP